MVNAERHARLGAILGITGDWLGSSANWDEAHSTPLASAFPSSRAAVHEQLVRELELSHRENEARLEAERRESSKQLATHAEMHAATVAALRASLESAEAESAAARAREAAAEARAVASEQQLALLQAVSRGEVSKLSLQLQEARALAARAAAPPAEAPPLPGTGAGGIVAELWALVQQQELVIKELLQEAGTAELN
jgi:hypothetical protein